MHLKVRLQDELSCACGMRKALRVDEMSDGMASAAWLCWKPLAGEEAAAGSVEAPDRRVGGDAENCQHPGLALATGKLNTLNVPHDRLLGK